MFIVGTALHDARRAGGGTSAEILPAECWTWKPSWCVAFRLAGGGRGGCAGRRFPTRGGLYAWEFERRGRELEVRVEGQLTFNTSPHMVAAALDGLGIAFLPEEEFAPHIGEGRLVRVLEDWCPPFPGYLYYPSRRHPSPAFSLVLEALRQ